MSDQGKQLEAVYRKVEEEMRSRIVEIDKKIDELRKEREAYACVIEAIRGLKAVEDRKAGRLAVQKGVCPFPNECNKRFTCTADSCNADTCVNGFAYKMS